MPRSPRGWYSTTYILVNFRHNDSRYNDRHIFSSFMTMRRMERCWACTVLTLICSPCWSAGTQAVEPIVPWDLGVILPCELLDRQRSIAVLRSGALVSGCSGSQPNHRVVDLAAD